MFFTRFREAEIPVKLQNLYTVYYTLYPDLPTLQKREMFRWYNPHLSSEANFDFGA